ncbi:unnamed protein product [Chilo suppressalis]|uniref:RdRp catalytic domain-containing protein n=1 Tax=Chilo suppressalis TaxID=168631 RepID=A0ABN8ATT3_CHISP|nr:unnamed protein product [Chilo suppressalis]
MYVKGREFIKDSTSQSTVTNSSSCRAALPSTLLSVSLTTNNENKTQIDTVVDRVMDNILNQSSDVLTQGRQTFCPFREQSVTAAQAYETAFDFLNMNTGRDCFSLIDWLQSIMECFEKETLTVPALLEVTVERSESDPDTTQKVTSTKIIKKMGNKTIAGRENVRKEMQRLVCSFASYIKHKERGKKDRRAIASATMLLRPFLHIIESFHLELSKGLMGSTISIGGEEKKAKITSNMEVTALDTELANHVSQGTEDATKWNECLSPAIFYLMHHYMFEPSLRVANLVPLHSRMGILFLSICKYGHLFQSWKRIQIGPGPIVKNKDSYTRILWVDEHEKSMNERTKSWYIKLKDKITEDRKYFMSSPGMLMGMLNAASTTIGLLPMNFLMQRNSMKVVCMRSSDDSTTKYLSNSAENNKLCVIRNKQNLSLIGINLSPDKTFFLPEGIAEYTSWYIDGKFVSQYGTEVPSIRPQGKSPYDDLYAIAKGTSTLLQTLVINHLGATARIRIGISACKKVWRLKETGSNLREGVSPKVQLIEDGGQNLWNCVNCHLNEIAMKRRLVTTDEENEYMYIITNPDNPKIAGSCPVTVATM